MTYEAIGRTRARRVIEGFDDCPFCQRIKINDYIPCDDPGTVRFEPLDPVTPGHMLFVPRAHHTDHPYVLGKTMQTARSYALNRQGDNVQGHNLITSYGSVATQTIAHMHVHYVPRRQGDGLALPWAPGRCAESRICILPAGHAGHHRG